MISDGAANIYTQLLSEVPVSFAVSCGDSSLERAAIANLDAYGLQLDHAAVAALVLDSPRGFAVAEIERLTALGRRVIAMTWSPCAEYWADLGDLGARIIVVGRQPDHVLSAVITHAAYGARYQITPEISTPLSPTERRVLHLLARGCSNQQIADRTSLRHQTVRNMLTLIYQKLGVADRSAALRYYWGICPTVAQFLTQTEPAPEK